MKLSILFLILFTTTICAQTSTTDEEEIYRDAAHPFTVRYAKKDWKIVKSSRVDSRIHLVNEGLFTEFSVRVADFPKDLKTDAEMVEVYSKEKAVFLKALLGNSPPDTKIDASGFTYLNNRKGVFIKTTTTLRSLDKSADFTSYIILAPYKLKAYVVTCSAPSELFDTVFMIVCEDMYTDFAFQPASPALKAATPTKP